MKIYNQDIKRLVNKGRIDDIVKILNSTKRPNLQTDCLKAISVLSKKNVVNPDAIKTSLYLLNSSNSKVCTYSAFAIGDMCLLGLYDEECILPLKNLMHNRDKNIRWSTTFALMNFVKQGVYFNDALDLFHKNLLDKFDKVTYNSAFAIGHLANMDIFDEETLINLISLLGDSHPYTRKASAFAVASLAKKGIFHKISLEPLNKLLEDKDKLTRKYAYEALSILDANGIAQADENKHTEININDSIVQRSKIGPTVEWSILDDRPKSERLHKVITNQKKETKIMDKFSNLSNELEYNILYNYLTSVARKACDKRFKYTSSLDEISHRKHLYEQGIIISYGDILEKFGKDRSNLSHQHQLYPILDEINKNNKPILLSALVVNKKEYLPSKPFFKKWDVESWESELIKIWHYYCEENELDNVENNKSMDTEKDPILCDKEIPEE